jgi:hypothetical protein
LRSPIDTLYGFADAVGGLQQLEQLTLVVVGEAVEGQGVLAHDQAGGQPGLLPHLQPGDGARGALHRQAHAPDLDHRTVG